MSAQLTSITDVRLVVSPNANDQSMSFSFEDNATMEGDGTMYLFVGGMGDTTFRMDSTGMIGGAVQGNVGIAKGTALYRQTAGYSAFSWRGLCAGMTYPRAPSAGSDAADMDRGFWSPRQIRSGFDNPKNQYRIADYFHVDEEYGTDQDLKDFCAEAHRLGMKVVFDLVYLHCGPTAPFLKEHPEFTWWNPDGTVKKGPWRFPKLNFAVPGLRAYLMDNIKSLIRDFGADGFRCDVGDGIPLDFWCDAHDMMDDLTGGNAVLLCEGFTVCDQYKGFDADYGWFPGTSAKAVRDGWTGRERQCPVGARFVNHYENHDIATDARPRREKAWGRDMIDQVLVWMFTLDGVPMLFTGNEIADADERHSMFGRTPMDWTQLDREPGMSRHAFVKRLAALRREHRVFTDVNGSDGLTWLDTTAEDAVTAFVRRNGRETILVVQNWTRERVECTVSFAVPKRETASYLAPDETDRDVRGAIAPEPLFVRDATCSPDGGFTIGPLGWWVSRVDEA